MTDLHKLLVRNQDKILPLSTLLRCKVLLPSSSDGDSSELISEVMQVKLTEQILSGIRRNIEFNKHQEQRKYADQFVKDRILSQVVSNMQVAA